MERLRVVAGRWARSPGEIVLSKKLASDAGLGIGDRVSALVNRRKIAYVVVGEAIEALSPGLYQPSRASYTVREIVSQAHEGDTSWQ